jgi:hypothetical protein
MNVLMHCIGKEGYDRSCVIIVKALAVVDYDSVQLSCCM